MDKKEVIFVLLNNFADWEGAYISTCLNMGVKPGCPIKYKVKTLSLSKEPITSIGGFRVLPDYDINDLPDDHAGLILIGGMNWFLPEAKPIASLVELRKANWLPESVMPPCISECMVSSTT